MTGKFEERNKPLRVFYTCSDDGLHIYNKTKITELKKGDFIKVFDDKHIVTDEEGHTFFKVTKEAHETNNLLMIGTEGC